jgi:hypothetical protein
VRNGILPDNVGGIVIAKDLEIAVVRPDPLVLNFHDLNHQGIEKDAAGRFIGPVSGVAFNGNFHIPDVIVLGFHIISPQRHPGETGPKTGYTG